MKKELPGTAFVKLGRMLRTSFVAEFRSIFGDEISPMECRVLGFIHENPGTLLKEVVDFFELTKSTGSEILSSLLEKGFVETRPDESDKRIKRLYVSPKGEAIDERAMAALRAHDERLFQGVSEEEIETATRIYEKVAANMKGGKP